MNQKQLEEKLFELIRRRDDDDAYNYPELVRDLLLLFGETAARKALAGLLAKPSVNHDKRIVIVNVFTPEEFKKLQAIAAGE